MTFILVKRTWPLGEKISIGTHVQPGIKAFSAKWSTSRSLFNLPRFFSNSIDKWCFLNFNYIHCMKARLNNQKLHYWTTHIFLVPLRKKEIFKWTLEHCMTKKIKSSWNWHRTCKNCRSNWISRGKQSHMFVNYYMALYSQYIWMAFSSPDDSHALGNHSIVYLWSMTYYDDIKSRRMRSMNWSSGFFLILFCVTLHHNFKRLWELGHCILLAINLQWLKFHQDFRWCACHVLKDRVSRCFWSDLLQYTLFTWQRNKKTSVCIAAH